MTNKNSERAIFFHVGLPKTASTFLQRNVFPHFKNIHFIKKHDFKHRDQIIQQSGSKNILLSIEINPDNEKGREKIKDVAEKYPNTYPIIVLRRHGSWLRSKYKYYLRKHGTKDFNGYFDPDENKGVLTHENLRFYPKIKLLESYYKHPPLVLFQEELKQAPFKVIDLLADYTGTTYNKSDIRIKTVKKSYSEKQLKLVRRFNKFYKFDNSGIKSKTADFVYKKFSALLLHSVAFFGFFFSGKNLKKESFITKEVIDQVNEMYKEDWDKCVEYAKSNREVFL